MRIGTDVRNIHLSEVGGKNLYNCYLLSTKKRRKI